MASEMEEHGCGIRPCTDSSIICTYGKLFYMVRLSKRHSFRTATFVDSTLFLFLMHVPNLWYGEYRYERLLTCEHNQ